MKKMIGIVLMTGLLMGTVAFGAMAYDRGNGPDQFQNQKRVATHGCYQPQMKLRDHRKKQIVVKKGVKRPAPVPKAKQQFRGAGRDERRMPQ
jgi:hypothetical protein